jgi:hypothetical protein
MMRVSDHVAGLLWSTVDYDRGGHPNPNGHYVQGIAHHLSKSRGFNLRATLIL